MTSRLFNVRLDDKRRRKARKLREAGRNLADVVRDAIDTEYASLVKSAPDADPAEVVDAILKRFPDPASLPPRRYDVHDARAARRAVLRSLKPRQ